MPKLLTGAEIVFKCLEDQKVEHIFGYPGGAVLPIYDELKNQKDLKDIKEKIAIKTRQYAKRQSTWARGNIMSWMKLKPQELNKFLKKI